MQLTGWVRPGATTRAPYGTCPVATESDVEDDVHAAKLGVKIATSKVRHRCSPRVRVWIVVPDICWNIASSEVPHLNSGRSPERSIDAAAVSVESCTVRGGNVGFTTTARETAACTAVCLQPAYHVSACLACMSHMEGTYIANIPACLSARTNAGHATG
jgi:hypothetical protein